MMSKHYEKIIQYNDEKLGKLLREKTKPVKTVDMEIQGLLRDLEVLARKNSKDGITLVGLSAPQVGVGLSVFVFYDLKTEGYLHVINPRIIYVSKEESSEWEGCASIGTGQKSLFAPVKRSRSSQIQYQTPEGTEDIISATNYQSHILLHEMDHLDGILFLDRVSDPKMIYTAAELDEFAKRNSGRYPKLEI